MPKLLKINPKYRTQSWLRQKYLIERLSCRQISSLIGISEKSVSCWIIKNGIKKRGNGGSIGRKTKKWLEKKYLVEKKSLRDIGNELGLRRETIHKWLKTYNIPRRPSGDPRKGKDSPHWRGGRYKEKQGYILIYSPTHPRCDQRGYVKEHRLIAEKLLKRFLLPKEVVHHINFVRSNNKPSNLHVFSSQAEHQKHHNALEARKERPLKSNLSE